MDPTATKLDWLMSKTTKAAQAWRDTSTNRVIAFARGGGETPFLT